MKKSAIFALVLGVGMWVPAMGSLCKPADAAVIIDAQIGFPIVQPAGVVYVDRDDWRYRHWREMQRERREAWDRRIAWERHLAWERREAYEHRRWEHCDRDDQDD